MKKFSMIIGLSALLISAVSGYFSIVGIALLFSGSFLSVAIMAASLEIGKLSIASFLYRYWNDITTAMKLYLTMGLLILMMITSMGVFGYLSDAYGSTAGTVKVEDIRINTLQSQKTSILNDISKYEKQNNYLPAVRDSFYTRRLMTSAKNVDKTITTNNERIEQLRSKQFAIDTTIVGIEGKLSLSNSGPLRYIAQLFDTTMDKVVIWLILFIMTVFDPAAIVLLIAFNITLFKKGRQTEFLSKFENESEDEVLPIHPIKPEVNDTVVTTNKIIDEPIHHTADIVNEQTAEIDEIQKSPEKPHQSPQWPFVEKD